MKQAFAWKSRILRNSICNIALLRFKDAVSTRIVLSFVSFAKLMILNREANQTNQVCQDDIPKTILIFFDKT